MHLGVLTSFIIDAVSEVDATVGPFMGESWLMRVEKGKVILGPLKEEALREFKERIAKRKELIRDLWLLCDHVGEDKVKEALATLSEKLDKDENNASGRY